jgi:ABC-type transporter Mla MlaB component
LAHDESPATPVSAQRPALEPSAKGLAIRGRIARTDVAGLCDRARPLLETTDTDVIVCDVGAIVDPDLSTIDALARLQLTARRLGRAISLSHASRELQELLTRMGLLDTVPLDAGSALKPEGEAEEREVALGVEEEADSGDLPP